MAASGSTPATAATAPPVSGASVTAGLPQILLQQPIRHLEKMTTMPASKFGNTPRPSKAELLFVAGMQSLDAEHNLDAAETSLVAAAREGERQLQAETTNAHREALAVCLSCLGYLMALRGQLDKTELMYLRSIELWEQVLGADNAKLVPLLLDFAVLCQMIGATKFDAAVAMLERAKGILDKTKNGALDAAGVLCTIGGFRAQQGKFDDADEAYNKAIASLEERGQPQHLAMALSMYAGYLKQWQPTHTDDLARVEARIKEARARAAEKKKAAAEKAAAAAAAGGSSSSSSSSGSGGSAKKS